MVSTPPPSKRTLTREGVEAAHISVVVAGAVLAVGGWSGLLWLVTNALPTVPNRWAFYALLQVAVTGTALPFVRLLHQRFSRQGGLFIRVGVLVRQATWVGLFVTTCVWLRIPRLLSVPLAVVVALGLAVIEVLLRLRERTQWRPD
jgi:cobalamin synthase